MALLELSLLATAAPPTAHTAATLDVKAQLGVPYAMGVSVVIPVPVDLEKMQD